MSVADELDRGSLLDRTLRNLRQAWWDIAASARGAISSTLRPDLPGDDVARLRWRMHACLSGPGGEVSARARTADLGRTYLSLSEVGREKFLRLLAEEFDTNPNVVEAAVELLRAAPNEETRRLAEAELRKALEAPWVQLLTQFNALPDGVKFLVDLRAELLRISRGDERLEAMEADLKGLLTTWFDIGFLELRRITWDSPAMLLEKLIAYEAVHEIRGWDDLKNRLEADRRCYAESLRVVALALTPLTPHLAEEIHELLGGTEGVLTASWPAVDESALARDEVEIAVQIKGKVKARIKVPSDADAAAVEAAALADETVQNALGDRTVRKVIVVPGRLVNIVA